MSISKRLNRLEKHVYVDKEETLLIIRSYGKTIREQGEEETLDNYKKYLDSVGIRYLHLNF